jgi:signal transduction histidine kinase
VLAILILLAEAAVVAALCADLGRDLGLLTPASRFALAAAACLLPLPLAWRSLRRRVKRPARAAALVLAATAAVLWGLVTIEEIGSQRMQKGWAEGGPDRLRSRADRLEADFAWLLQEMVRPFGEGRWDASRPSQAFRMLERAHRDTHLPASRYGLSLYRADGEALAWTGNSSQAPPALIEATESGTAYLMAGGEEAPRLYALTIDRFTGLRRVAEFLVQPATMTVPGELEGPLRLEFLPHWGAIEPAGVQVHLAQADADDMANLFERQGDRHWWRVGRQRLLTLTVPLRAPDGTALASATLTDRRAAEELTERRLVVRRLGVLLAAAGVLLAALQIARSVMLPTWLRILTGMAAIAGARWILLLVGADDMLPRLPIYDIAIYASTSLYGLLRSPADLLLTAAAALATAWLARAALDRIPVPGGAPMRLLLRSTALVALAALLFGGGNALHRFLDELVLESRLDLSRVEFDRHVLPRLALQGGLFLLVAAGALLALGLYEVQRRCRVRDPGRQASSRAFPGRRRLPPLALAAIAVVVTTAIYVPFLQHAYRRLLHDFFENDLMPRVLYQSDGRMEILEDALRTATTPEFALLASEDELEATDRTPAGLAYRLWSRTSLAAMGLSSSLRVYDADGRLVSRFAVNLGLMFEPLFWQAREAAEKEPIAVLPRPGVTVRKAVIFGSRWVQAARRPPRLVVMSVIDDYDNVPLLGAEKANLPLLRTRALSRSNPELLRYETRMAVFGPGLERVYESEGEIPAPSPAAVKALEHRRFIWSTDDVGEGRARILYFRGPKEVFALAYPERDVIGRLAGFLRLFLQNAALLLGVVAVARFGRELIGQPAAGPPHGGTFYARLTTVFLISALAPLLSLAYFVTRVSAREYQRGLVSSGLISLQTARRVAADYLHLADPGYSDHLDEDVVFWLSRVVRQDINVYRDADLMATSTPELYGSSLLNYRLSGEVFRALYLDRDPFRLSQERIADFDYLTLSAPMRIDRAGTVGVISIPLSAQSRLVARKVEELADGILLSSFLTVLLLAVVGWLVARRVSEPIASLAHAAQNVALGDLDVRVTSASRDEIGTLVASFNRMAGSLRDQRQDLERRKDYIETILARATTGVLSLDARGTVITINPAGQRLLAPEGAPPVPGESLTERLGRQAPYAPLRDALQRSLEGGTEVEVALVVGLRGQQRRLRGVFLPFKLEEDAAQGRIVLIEDVTEIVRSGQLAAWAEMARRIAHEVKNPLTPIQLSVDHIQRLWRAGDRRFGQVLGECLANIQGQVQVLRQIVTEFSAYSRLPQLRLESTPVSSLLQEALRPYVTAPPPGIAIDQSVPPDLPPLLIDRAVVTRALVNLVENALQAMPGGGRLTVSADRVDGERSGSLRITVRDSGVGIDPAILSRIFEPYFSTKSGGSGLGLAIARRAIEEHGGAIKITSHPGQGTLVTMVLPVAP